MRKLSQHTTAKAVAQPEASDQAREPAVTAAGQAAAAPAAAIPAVS